MTRRPACSEGWAIAACATKSASSATLEPAASAQGFFIHVYVERTTRRPGTSCPAALRIAAEEILVGLALTVVRASHPGHRR